MAIELMDEHEQSELVRNWLRQNAVAILVGILAGLAAIVGWQQWQGHRATRGQDAQLRYRELITAEAAGDREKAQALAQSIRSEYDDSPYAALAAMEQAEQAVAASDLDAAATALSWAREQGSPAPVAELAALRLGQVRLAQGQPQAALELAESVESKALKGLSGELRGDALQALGRAGDARAAYESALESLAVGTPQRFFVEMKRDSLAEGSVAAAAPATSPAATPAASPATPSAPAQAAQEKGS